MSEFHVMAQFGALEATRRQAEGDLAGAWTYLLGLIRSALHEGRHTGVRFAEDGTMIIGEVAPLVTAWVLDERQTSESLRQAAAKLRECRQLEWSATDLIRVEYFLERANLRDPQSWRERGKLPADPNAWEAWVHHLAGYATTKNFLRNEPKRSQQILRLITAGLLAQVERPAEARPPMVSPEHMIYAIDAATPSPLTRIAPARLAAWADASGAHDAYLDVDWRLGRIHAALAKLDQIRLEVAERAYQLEHDGRPAKTYGDLLGPNLDRLPAGIAPDDLLAPL